MKKFKIIEKSRFLKEEDMSDIQGGVSCSPNSPYSACSGIGHISCQPAATLGYSSSTCNGLGDLHTCGTDMNYSISVCLGWALFTSTCGGGITYQG